MLGDRLLALLKSERILTRAEMLDFWNLHRQEDDIAADQAHAETAERLRAQAGPAAQRQLDELAQRLRRGATQAERRLQHQAAQIGTALREGADRHRGPIRAELARAGHGFDGATQEADTWRTQLGGGGSPGAQIELGRHLATNPKIQKLAALVGRMRQQARALRRTVFERATAELYDVGRGAEVSRLLPAELLALRHRVLRRDFLRRLVASDLLQYSLRAPEDAGRGPMVVCIDGSSSMAGEKEIWAKAVSLTLLDIAQPGGQSGPNCFELCIHLRAKGGEPGLHPGPERLDLAANIRDILLRRDLPGNGDFGDLLVALSETAMPWKWFWSAAG